MLAKIFAEQNVEPFRDLTDDDLSRIRALRSALSARWSAVAPGDTLVVPFPAVASVLP